MDESQASEPQQQEPLFEAPASGRAAGKERPRDPLWDTLTEYFGEPRTKSERGRRNRALRELREAETTTAELQTVLDYCARNFSNFTEVACCSWLARALHEQQKETAPSNVLELFRKAQER